MAWLDSLQGAANEWIQKKSAIMAYIAPVRYGVERHDAGLSYRGVVKNLKENLDVIQNILTLYWPAPPRLRRGLEDWYPRV